MNKFFAASMALAFALTAGSAFAEGDAKKGAKVFKKCKACHTALDSGKSGMGPNLKGIIGRPAGTLEGFTKYSDALKNSGITWDEDSLETWLDKKAGGPKTMVPGNKMGFKGLKEKDAKNVIAYLKENG